MTPEQLSDIAFGIARALRAAVPAKHERRVILWLAMMEDMGEDIPEEQLFEEAGNA